MLNLMWKIILDIYKQQNVGCNLFIASGDYFDNTQFNITNDNINSCMLTLNSGTSVNVLICKVGGDFMNFDCDLTNNYSLTNSNSNDGAFFTNVASTVRTLVTYIENSDISGKVFDITNGGDFENNVLYVDNLNTGGLFFSASKTT